MSIPKQSQVMGQSRHIMYVKDDNGEWVRYMQAKNLKSLMDLFEKKGDGDIEVVRIQRLKVTTTFSAGEYDIIDPWDYDQVETLLEEDQAQRLKTHNRKRKKNNDSSN